MKQKTQKEILLEKFNKSLKKPLKKKITPEEKAELERKKAEREKKMAEQREITSEEMIMQKEISTVEMTTLQKVFQILCNVTPLQQYVENVKNTKSQFYSVNNLSHLDQDQFGEKNFFTGQDIMKVLNQLDYFPTQTEIDTYIWEINDLMTGRVYWYEFELMYRRCSLDTQAQEPTDLFIIIEFLMYLCKAEEADAHEEELNKKEKKAKKNILFEEDVDDSSDSDEKDDQNYQNSNINSRQSPLGNHNNTSQIANTQEDEIQERKFFKYKTINFDNALELLFTRHGKDKINQVIYDIFGVKLEEVGITEKTKNNSFNQYKSLEDNDKLNNLTADNINLNNNNQQQQNKNGKIDSQAQQAFNKILTIQEYYDIMKDLEFERYSEQNQEKNQKYNGLLDKKDNDYY